MTTMEQLARWYSSGETISAAGWRIFARVEGQGDPLLMLHGFPTAGFDYARLIPLLRDRFRCITFDFLGFGFSQKPRPHAYSLFEQADIAEAAAAHFGLTKLTLLTHDMGNSVTLELLKRGRLDVRRVVMLNGSVLLRHYRPVLLQRLLLHPVVGPALTALRLVGRAGFGRQFAGVFAQPPPADEIDAFWALVAHHDGARIYDRLIQYLNERKVHELAWLEALERHRAPLTVVWGQRDPVSVPQIAQAVLERRPDARYVPLAEVGHYPQWEAPEAVAKAVNES
ncbi:MAG: alpha/beta hydrolase [Anaerolineae bacterium]|nr:alpha/beta hydrolase [Anaerolineae bacterium]NUQ03934.1 alpha/beta hydrolase [Anaerolineae bacterium]